jgi:hypothetical protein
VAAFLRSTLDLMRPFVPVALFALALAPPATAQRPEPRPAAALQAPGANPPALRAGRLAGPIRLDGVLDEPAWAAADSIADLTQTEPVQGARPTGRTVVRVLAGDDVLLIGIRADDPEPSGIVAFARSRDAGLGDEDHVVAVLDTYLDGRSGYAFSVNPAGARRDAVITNQGEDSDDSWDAAWEAAAARTAGGWSVEIRIPVRSLMFRGGLDTWGFNVQRRIQRLQETDRWASPSRDYGVTQTSRAGRLTGLPDFSLGLGLSVRPAVTGGGHRDAPSAGFTDQEDASLDVTQRLGANTLASVTVNTDFAETEVDTRRTNLTRFPLYFPEKRTFFLEGTDIFAFGSRIEDEVSPFFSRRIGLLSGRQVPIRVGGKVHGRVGSTNFGALVVRTGALDTLAPATTMGVVRVRQNVLRESSLGLIATFGDPRGVGGSWTAGADLLFKTSRLWGGKNFLAALWGLAMDRTGLGGAAHAVGARLDYPNDLWDFNASYRIVDSTFQPSLGFVPRPGVQTADASVRFNPRPRRFFGVREMEFEVEGTAVTDLRGEWESYDVSVKPLDWVFDSGDQIEFNVSRRGERLIETFEIADGVVIAPGPYHYTRYHLAAALAEKRRLSGWAEWSFGRFYDGTLHSWELGATWRPNALLIFDLSGERNVGRLAVGRFVEDLVGLRARINFSPDLQLNSYVQYDNESQSLGTNTRLRWTFDPLGDLFVVYNHNISTLGDRWAFESNQLLIKVQYTWRM